MWIQFARRVCWPVLLAALALFTPSARAEDVPSPRRETWFLEAGVGASQTVHDAYTERLADFRFETPLFGMLDGFERLGHSQSLGVMLHENVGILLRHDLLESRAFERQLQGRAEDTFEWTTHAFSFGVRGRKPLLREWFAVYGQATLGLGAAFSIYQNHGQNPHHETHLGPSLGLAAGLDVNFFKFGGLFVEGGYNYSPVIRNDFGDRHNDGGATWQIGLRARFLEAK